MVEVSSTGRKILYDNDINFTNPTPVIQLYPRAYGQSDAFVPADEKTKKKPSFVGRLVRDAIGLTALWFAGRKGWLGKGIKNWLHGVISNKKFNKIINERMTKYLSKGKKTVQSTEILKDANGKQILKATFQDGSTKEYTMRMFKGKVILTGNTEQERTFLKVFKRKPQQLEERIIFDRKDGAVAARTMINNEPQTLNINVNGTEKTIQGTKAQASVTYRGETVLDEGFNEYFGAYKDTCHKGPFRRFLLAGPQTEKSCVRFFAGDGKPEKTLKNRRIFDKSGSLRETAHKGPTLAELRIYLKNRRGK